MRNPKRPISTTNQRDPDNHLNLIRKGITRAWRWILKSWRFSKPLMPALARIKQKNKS